MLMRHAGSEVGNLNLRSLAPFTDKCDVTCLKEHMRRTEYACLLRLVRVAAYRETFLANGTERTTAPVSRRPRARISLISAGCRSRTEQRENRTS